MTPEVSLKIVIFGQTVKEYYTSLVEYISFNALGANVCKNRATGGHGKKLIFPHILSIHTY